MIRYNHQKEKKMTKTVWKIIDETDNIKTELTYYHFGKEPKFPAWYMEENHIYTIEMIWNLKLIKTPTLFLKCLFHQYIIK